MATSMSNILLDKEILLESGTNELELLVFDVADFTFGINVAKVREVLPIAEITALPRAHSSIRGVFKLRNNVIPCVSLLDHLGITSERENAESRMILSDFNQQQTAFLVDDVERIHRLSWENILPVPGLEALSSSPVTALARCDNRLVVMLDFEMILDDVTSQYFRTDAVDNPLGLPREQLKILLAEDSPTVRETIGNTLRNSGYTQLLFFDNGEEAWQWISQRLKATGQPEEVCDLIISDVEMPKVDGFHLTKRVKEHPELKQLPVLLYSSIITPDNHKKGMAVGADAQVAKPELTEVVRLADELITTAQRENRAAALRAATEIAQTEAHRLQRQASPAEPQPAKEPAATPTAPSPPVEPPSVQAPPVETLPKEAPSPEPLANDVQGQGGNGDVSPPTGVAAKIWQTFHRELQGRIATLQATFERSRAGDRGDDVFREVARTLHTIKSAAMVIPLDQVTRCTHLTESLMEAARDDRDQWPQAGLDHYLAWLESLVSPPDGNIDAAMAAGSQLETELTP